jgi:putative phage-type endonuclease
MALTIQQRIDRRLGIGGSDIAAILGISKWNTPLDIYLEKLSTEEPMPEVSNQFQEWGNRLEHVLVEAFEELTGIKCATGLDTFIHPEYNYMRANIDAKLIGENAILECKTANQFAGKEWSTLGGDNIPEPYLLQCAYYAEITQCAKVYIAVLIGGNDFRIYAYDRNPALGKLIMAKVIDFWENHVLKQIPPHPVNHLDAIKLWRTTESNELKLATDEILKTIKELHSLKTDKENLEVQLNSKRLELYNFMQEAQQINSQNGDPLVTWKMQTSNRFDAKRFMVEHPEMYALYIKTSESRVLRIKGDKNG